MPKGNVLYLELSAGVGQKFFATIKKYSLLLLHPVLSSDLFLDYGMLKQQRISVVVVRNLRPVLELIVEIHDNAFS